MLNNDKQSISCLYENVNRISLNQQKVNFILENNNLSFKFKPELKAYLEYVYAHDTDKYDSTLNELIVRIKNNTLDENWWQGFKSGAKSLMGDVGKAVGNAVSSITPLAVKRGVGDVKGRIHATQPHADTGKLLTTLADTVNKFNDVNKRLVQYKINDSLNASIANGTLESYVGADASGKKIIPQQLTDFNNSLNNLIATCTKIKKSISQFQTQVVGGSAPAAPAAGSAPAAPAAGSAPAAPAAGSAPAAPAAGSAPAAPAAGKATT